MFYLEASEMEAILRFGDVIQGFPICFSVIDKPSHESDFHITVSAPSYAVVLSPCCSIKDKVLSLAPLKQLENKIFVNPYLGACRRNGIRSRFLLIWSHYGKDIQILRPKTNAAPAIVDGLASERAPRLFPVGCGRAA